MTKKNLLEMKTSIRYVKGVGPKMEKQFQKMDIKTIDDLINHFPFRHEDYSQITNIQSAGLNQKITLIGKINNFTSSRTRSARYKTIQKATFKDKTGEINLIWFNQPYLKNNLKTNSLFSVSGKITQRNNQLQMLFPSFEVHGKETTKNTGRLVPIYSTTNGITNQYLRKIVTRAFAEIKTQIKETLPSEILSEYQLIDKKTALINIHFPKNKSILKQARYRLGFEELFNIQIKNIQQKQKWKKSRPAPKLSQNLNLIKKFSQSLPFKLTAAQKKVIKEILGDIEQPNAMNRLLQGDVGSGKTVVGAAAILQTAENNYQSIFMAPTEILAQQHYKTLKKLLRPFKINCQLLTSNTTKQINHQSLPPNTQLLIGTHALIHKHARFNQVGLVIIDEQHRFGVAQRSKLVNKAKDSSQKQLMPHILTMTATPIPRTIALTIYGSLDISRLDELPPGRKPVKTSLVPKRKRQNCYQWIKKEINNGYQGFIICPLVEESENLESVKSATEEFQKLSREVFPNLKLGLLHGQMKSQKKDKVLRQMHQRKIDLLVATPVVEVGIDIPNARFMIIEAANRFGLAQLHQLRGRVGRGEDQAYCFLFAEKISEKAKKRIRAMEKINDGLELAKIDLKIRGPGEIYGTKQHGYIELKVADYNDLDLIKKTRRAAHQVHISKCTSEVY